MPKLGGGSKAITIVNKACPHGGDKAFSGPKS
jgi:hypothetical protein